MSLGVRKDSSGAILFCQTAEQVAARKRETKRRLSDKALIQQLRKAVLLLAEDASPQKKSVIDKLLRDGGPNA